MLQHLIVVHTPHTQHTHNTHTHTHTHTQLDQFVVGDLIGALAADSLNESHPILQEVSSPNEINSLFDSISYSKVCTIHCINLELPFSETSSWSNALYVTKSA